MTLRKRRILVAICCLVFLVSAPLLLLYTLGYRIDSNLNIKKTGGLYVSSPISGSEIYIKNKKEKETNILQSGLFKQNLAAGVYSVLIAKEEFWPWLKNLEIKEGLVTEARAFLIPKNPKGTMLLRGAFTSLWASPYDKVLLLEENKGGDRQLTFYLPATDTFLTVADYKTKYLLSHKEEISKIFWEDGAVLFEIGDKIIQANFDFNNQTVKAAVASNQIPLNHKYEKLSNRKQERLFWDNKTNEVWIEWLADKNSIPYYLCDNKPCQETFYPISSFRFPVKNADFFPGRKDLLIAAVQNSVFALEVDGRGDRLSHPIYKGRDPTFAVLPGEKTIYILDGGTLLAINLE